MARHDRVVCILALATRRPVRAVLAVALVAATATASAPVACAQYDSIDPQINAAQASQLVAKVTSVMRDPQAGPADLKVVDEYFIKFFFPMMTSDDPQQLALLVENKEKLLRQFINIRGVSPAGQKYLVDRTAAVMRAVASGAKGKNYHPAVRYNAALILGQLDQAPAANGKPPAPLTAATGDLLGLVEGETIPMPVKVAALVGLERHTRFGADAQYADRIATSVLALATTKQPPEDVSAAAFDWTRGLAARVLINQFSKGGLTAPVQNALVELIGSKELNLDDRCKVAKALSATMYEGAQGVDAEAMVRALGQLAQDVLAAESKDAQKYIDAMLGGGGADFAMPMEGGRGGGGAFGGGGGGGGYGRRGVESGGGRGGGFDPTALEAEQGPRYERRRLLDRILAICAGGRATSGGASDEVKQQIDALVTPLQETADVAASKEAGDAAVTEMVVELAHEVNRVVNSWGGDAEPAAADAEPEDALGAAAAAAPAADEPAAEEPAAAEAAPAAAEDAAN